MIGRDLPKKVMISKNPPNKQPEYAGRRKGFMNCVTLHF